MNAPRPDSPSRPTSREDLIATLSEDIAPVKRVRRGHGAAMIVLATLVATAAAIAYFGFWSGMVDGSASPYFWIVNGLLLLVGAASASTLVASALPRVGQRSSAPLWSAAMLAVVPVAAVISLISLHAAHDGAQVAWYWECAAYGVTAGLIVAIAAVAFLRRGAPVAVERAGWLVGLAAGALGSVAYGITCPLDTLTHVGIVHVAPVAIGAVLGRLVVPPLIRW